MEKERSGFRRLIDIAQALAKRRTEDATLDKVLDWAIQQVQAEEGYIVVPTKKDAFAVRAARGLGGGSIDDDARSVSKTLLRHALDMGESLASKFPWESLEGTKGTYQLHYTTHTLGRVAKSVIVAPLTLEKGRCLGMLVLHERKRAKAFSRNDLLQIEPLAGIAATLLENAVGVEPPPVRHGLVGSSRPFRAFMDLAEKAARSHQMVLIQGESGSGKEGVAQLMHNLSPRANGRFVVVNSSCFSETLIESLLFGYVKGAFTGADRDEEGVIATARGGTLFFDEIGEASPVLQAKLLRVIQEKTFRPVGGKADQRADVRIVAATNRDLEEMVRRGEFREDLFYRLRVIRLTVPSLRERRDDIEPLARHFLEKVAREEGRPPKALGPGCLEVLAAHDWPGNVRELENVIRAAFVLGQDPLAPGDFDIPKKTVVAREAARDHAEHLEKFIEAARALEQARAEGSEEPWLLVRCHKATFYRRLAWGEERQLTLEVALQLQQNRPT